jgi:hypothetical protein
VSRPPEIIETLIARALGDEQVKMTSLVMMEKRFMDAALLGDEVSMARYKEVCFELYEEVFEIKKTIAMLAKELQDARETPQIH